MHLDWKSLYYGKVTKEEVAEAVQDAEWQALREMIKGQPLETKYNYLTAYQRKKFENLDSMTAHELRMVEVRLTNYVTALSRGGLIKPMDYRGEMSNHEKCPLYRYCLTQKHENDTCDYMLRKYNAGLLLPPEYKEEENEQSSFNKHSAEKV